MDSKEYKPNRTILLLCEQKKDYQRNIIFAWFVVTILSGLVCCYFLTMDNSYNENMADRIIASSFESNNGNGKTQKSSGSSGNRTERSRNTFFASAGKVKYKIVKDSHFANLNFVNKSTPTIYTDFDSTGSDDLGVYSFDFAYSDGDEFGLPGELSMIDFYYKEKRGLSSGYNFHKINIPENNSIACIDWVHPRWPKNGRGLYAKVSALVFVSSSGKKKYEIVKEDPPDYGFAGVFLEAINESIFWPAKDIYGNNLDGSYLITYEFCSKCKENTVKIISGDVVIKPRKKY